MLYYSSLISRVTDVLQEKTTSITSENIQETIDDHEWVFIHQNGTITASPRTTKMLKIPFITSLTRYDGEYRMRHTQTLDIGGTLVLYEDVTKEIEGYIHLLIVSGFLLLFLTLLSYGVMRGIVWYGFSGLDRIAAYCDEVTQALASGNIGGIESTILGGAESEEIRTVSDALQTMMDHMHRYIQQQHIFTHGMSHEFKTQLMHLQSDLDIIKDSTRDTSVFNELQTSLHGFTHLVDQLLLLATNDQKSEKHAMESIQAGGVIQSCIERHNISIQNKHIDLQIDIIEEDALVCYVGLYEVLIENLVSNAVKYTPNNGIIGVTLTDIGLSIRNSIEDMQTEDIDVMFELFRVKDTARSDVTSHGIGLALVKRIVEIHGRTITGSLTEEGLFEISIIF